MDKSDLQDWVRDAVVAAGGSASLVRVARHIWEHHEAELRRSGDRFYTWQYDMRWAATILRKQGMLRSAELSPAGIWELASTAGRARPA